MDVSDTFAITAGALWLPLAALVGIVAHRRGRFGFAWFLASAVITPVVPGLLVLVLPRVKLADPQTTDIAGQDETASPQLRLIFVVVAAVMVAFFGWSLVAPIQNWNNPNEDGFSYLNFFWAMIVCLPVALYMVLGAFAGHGRRVTLARKALIIGCVTIVIVVAFLIFQQIANATGG